MTSSLNSLGLGATKPSSTGATGAAGAGGIGGGGTLNRFAPALPENFEDLGLSQSFVMDLMLRRLLLEGFSSLTSLSQTLKLSVTIIEIVFKHLRAQQLIEVKGMIGNDYSFL